MSNKKAIITTSAVAGVLITVAAAILLYNRREDLNISKTITNSKWDIFKNI